MFIIFINSLDKWVIFYIYSTIHFDKNVQCFCKVNLMGPGQAVRQLGVLWPLYPPQGDGELWRGEEG